MLSLKDLATEVVLYKLETDFDSEFVGDMVVKLNGQEYSLNYLQEKKITIVAILDYLIQYLISKDKRWLEKPITYVYKPLKNDNLSIKVGIPEEYKSYYRVEAVGNTISIKDFLDQQYITLTTAKSFF